MYQVNKKKKKGKKVFWSFKFHFDFLCFKRFYLILYILKSYYFGLNLLKMFVYIMELTCHTPNVEMANQHGC